MIQRIKFKKGSYNFYVFCKKLGLEPTQELFEEYKLAKEKV